MADTKFVLASRSPRRVQLLTELGIEFEVRPADVDETPQLGEEPTEYVGRLAHDKSFAVVSPGANEVVIGADTTVDVDGVIFGQPVDENDAREMLMKLSGRSHLVHTGLCVIASASGIAITEVVTSQVTFAELSHDDVDNYLASGEWSGKAGGYAIQGLAGTFVTALEGSWSNVVGLPTEALTALLSTVNP